MKLKLNLGFYIQICNMFLGMFISLIIFIHLHFPFYKTKTTTWDLIFLKMIILPKIKFFSFFSNVISFLLNIFKNYKLNGNIFKFSLLKTTFDFPNVRRCLITMFEQFT